MCKGTGKIGPTLLLDEALERHLSAIAEKKPGRSIRLVVNPVTYAYITKGWWNSLVSQWKRKYKCPLKVLKDDNFAINQSLWEDVKTSRPLGSFFD